MLFYDYEVFRHNWLVVIQDSDERKERVIIDDRKEMLKFYESHKNNIWCGFNSRHYDQYILKAILSGCDPKEVSDYIIAKGENGWKFSPEFRKWPLLDYDVMMNNDVGLKSLEGFMGNDIRETSVPFDIDRPLTTEEIKETVKYCMHDVEQTIEVFMRRISEFNTMLYFIRHFHLSLVCISKTKAQLAALILGGNCMGQTFNDEFEFPILDCIRLDKYKAVADWYRKEENHSYSKEQKVTVAGVPHTFAWGGGHGAISKYSADGVFLVIDVTAYYPSLQKEFHFGYRVMNHPENFEYIHSSNLKYKAAGDKKARLPFKIMDNAISGQMKQRSSTLFDPMSNNAICINGQLLLLDLVEKIEGHCKLIQNNTDGIIVQLLNYPEDFYTLDDIVHEWEVRTGMSMEFDLFIGSIYQADVNNYILVDRETGATKAKGGYLKQLNDLSYDLPIINIALTEYMINRTPVEDTINNCNDLQKFQKIVKLSKLYDHVEWQHGKYETKKYYKKGSNKKIISKVDYIYKEPNLIFNNKSYRIFASRFLTDGQLLKCRIDQNGKYSFGKFGNTPDHCFIWNEAVTGRPVPARLSRQWYIDIAKKRLKQKFGMSEERDEKHDMARQ